MVPVPYSEINLISTSNTETLTNGVTVGEYATFKLNFTIPEGVTLYPRLMIRSWNNTAGILFIVNITLTLPSNINGTKRVIEFDDYNQDSYNDTVVITFDSLVNQANNVADSNDWIVVELVTFVTPSVINTQGMLLILSGSLSHSNGTNTIVEATRYSYLRIVMPELTWIIDSNVTRGDAGDFVDFNVTIFHANTSTAPAYNVEAVAFLLPFYKLINASLVVANADNVVPEVSTGIDALAGLPKLVQGASLNISFSTYLDDSVQASSIIHSTLRVKYATSYIEGRDIYPYYVFFFSLSLLSFGVKFNV